MADDKKKVAPPPVSRETAPPAQSTSTAPLTPLSNDFDDVLREEIQRDVTASDESFAPAPRGETDRTDDADFDVTGTQSETPSTEATAETTTVAPAVAEKPATPPAPAVQPEAHPEATPAAPSATTETKVPYDPQERIALVDGVEIPRGTIVQGLNERVAALQEVNEWRGIFRGSLADAQQYWKPLVDSIVQDPEKGEYLERAIAHYDAEKMGTRAPQAQPLQDTEARAAAARVETQLRNMQIAQAQQQIATERATLESRYPALRDPRVYEMLRSATVARFQQGDQTYTLTRAANDLSAYLERLAPQETTNDEPLPALLGSGGGAAPAAQRRTDDDRPRKFASADEAAEDFARRTGSFE